jgi:hypothetical protein
MNKEQYDVLNGNFRNEDTTINLKKEVIVNYLTNLLDETDLKKIRSEIFKIKNDVLADTTKQSLFITPNKNGQSIQMGRIYFNNELNQIIETLTLERTKYYISRLIKSLTQIRTGRINDINLNRWKEYSDIITDSLWILDKRDTSGTHKASYWGNFIPQIPNQFLRRYTKKGDWVLDTFLGSGTTLIECKRLGRNGIGMELQEDVAKDSQSVIQQEKNAFNVQTELIIGDSTDIDYENLIDNYGIKKVQFLIMHPPYWDIIKFSEDKRDLSNAETVNDFLEKLMRVVDKTYPILEKKRYLALVLGDKYEKGEWIPLGFLAMQEILKRKYKLKSIIVKNFDETKAKRQQKELWRYRALVGGFYIFKHEYIFLFEKR